MGNKRVNDAISQDTSAWHTVKGQFEAEIYDSRGPLDTRVTLEIPDFCISWNNRKEFMEELAALIEKYSL